MTRRAALPAVFPAGNRHRPAPGPDNCARSNRQRPVPPNTRRCPIRCPPTTPRAPPAPLPPPRKRFDNPPANARSPSRRWVSLSAAGASRLGLCRPPPGRVPTVRTPPRPGARRPASSPTARARTAPSGSLRRGGRPPAHAAASDRSRWCLARSAPPARPASAPASPRGAAGEFSPAPPGGCRRSGKPLPSPRGRDTPPGCSTTAWSRDGPRVSPAAGPIARHPNHTWPTRPGPTVASCHPPTDSLCRPLILCHLAKITIDLCGTMRATPRDVGTAEPKP